MDRGIGGRVNPCASSTKDRTIINRIMLRFRPIAPKPVDGDSSPGNLKPENKNCFINKGRRKRKYVRVKKKNNNNEQYPHRSKKKVASISSSDQETQREEDHGTKLALQLLPGQKKIGSEVIIQEERSLSCDGVDDVAIRDEEKKDQESLSITLNFNSQLIDDMGGLIMSDLKDRKRKIVETQVTVESVTDTCMDLELSGSTDVERVRNLGKDTCPWFISDGLNEVRWVNEAYKKMVMVGQDDDGQPLEITVGLEIREKFLVYLYCSAFTCWVRLKYTWQKEKCSQMVPCDAWKMDFGGFAWRLDVKAALSLGLK